MFLPLPTQIGRRGPGPLTMVLPAMVMFSWPVSFLKVPVLG